MREPRLLIEERLAAGAEIALPEGQARHVGTVLRLDVGDALRVFNMTDGEWRARILAKKKQDVRVRIETFVRTGRQPGDLELLFAPVKRHATDLIVEKATELGVRRIRPVMTERTIAETVRIERLEVIAREAAEQTERFDAPEICEPASLARALDRWDGSRPLIYCDEHGEAPPLLEALHQLRQARSAALSLLIGPEGGFSTEERGMLRALTFVVPVSLGPRILRAETAAVAALSIIQAVWGDWR
jgi:16S rRNA (uracil1498-N3)-methyltransferase